MDERRPPDGEAHIRSHGLSRAERTATAAINKEAELNGLPPLEHPAPPLERCLGPLLEELRTRSSDGMSKFSVKSERNFMFVESYRA